MTSPRPSVDATLGPGDVFDVRVFDEAQLSGTYRVDPDGAIEFPMVGTVRVAGRLPAEVQARLRDLLRRYLKEPEVSVFVREVNSKKVIIYGQVAKPGTFAYSDPMTISQAISLAGGFAPMAAREHVTISRFERQRQRLIKVDCRAIADGKSPNQFVLPGDEVYVPERLF